MPVAGLQVGDWAKTSVGPGNARASEAGGGGTSLHQQRQTTRSNGATGAGLLPTTMTMDGTSNDRADSSRPVVSRRSVSKVLPESRVLPLAPSTSWSPALGYASLG
jgi:hypothetical protein